MFDKFFLYGVMTLALQSLGPGTCHCHCRYSNSHIYMYVYHYFHHLLKKVAFFLGYVCLSRISSVSFTTILCGVWS